MRTGGRSFETHFISRLGGVDLKPKNNVLLLVVSQLNVYLLVVSWSAAELLP